MTSKPMRAAWWVSPLVPVFVSMLGASCGGGIAGNAPSSDAGSNPDSGCEPLAACCDSLPAALQSLCASVATQGNADNCATELGQLAATGYCAAQAPSDAGDATTGGGSGSGGRDAGGSGSSGGPDGSGNGSSGGPDGSGSGSSSGGTSMCSTPCAAPQVCVALPGAGGGTCANACQSDADCPAFMTCSAGTCSWQCTSCPAGQECKVVAGFGPGPCTSNAQCGIGGYCDQFLGPPGEGGPPQEGNCNPYEACAACTGGCPSCTANSQCEPGQVCAGGSCQACTTNSQCGPTAQCTANHTGFECTCTVDGDCAADEICSGGICGYAGNECIPDGGGPPGCPTGQVCIAGACGPCSSFDDCNVNLGPFGTRGQGGLACVDGVCTQCTANSQCGGGQACVGGTCGTCVANAQCGSTGQCTDGFCTCTSDQQCAAAQRCGAGVCVAM